MELATVGRVIFVVAEVRVYVPIVTCVVLSIVATIVLNLISRR